MLCVQVLAWEVELKVEVVGAGPSTGKGEGEGLGQWYNVMDMVRGIGLGGNNLYWRGFELVRIIWNPDVSREE